MIGNWIEKQLRRIPRLPRKWRVVRNLTLSLLAALFIWTAAGSPLPLMAEFRRAERSLLIGPTEVIAHVESDAFAVDDVPDILKEHQSSWGYDRLLERMEDLKHVIVGERGNLLTWFVSTGSGWSYCGAREKDGEVTLWPIHTEISTSNQTEARVSTAKVIVLHTEVPGAYHASLEWRSILGPYYDSADNCDVYYTNRCSGTGTVQENGIFVIPVFMSSRPMEEYEGIDGRFDLAEVRLVLRDRDGTVIYDEILTIEEDL